MNQKETDELAFLHARTKTCAKCETALLLDSVFCHRAGFALPFAPPMNHRPALTR